MLKRDVFKEYIRKVNDEDLRNLSFKLTQRIGSDIAEVVEFIQKNNEVDKLLASAKNANEFFDMIDHFDSVVESEMKRRFSYQMS